MKNIYPLILAFLLPPLAIFKINPKSVWFKLNLLLSILAIVIFLFFMAGIGITFYALAIAHALIYCVSNFFTGKN